METTAGRLVTTRLYHSAKLILQEKKAGNPFPKKLLNVSFNPIPDDTWATNLSNIVSEYHEELDGLDISGRRLGLGNVSGISTVTNDQDESNCIATKKAYEIMRSDFL